MKRRLAVLMVIGLILGLGVSGPAQGPPSCPLENRDRCFVGFEVDLQLGGPFPSSMEGDFGLLAGGSFNIGIGGSLANIETIDMAGGYAKLGILTFDILKGKLLVGRCTSSWYAEGKLKIPFPLWLICEDVVWPLSIGCKFSQLSIYKGHDFCHSERITPFFGIDAVFNNLQSEIWLEFHLPFERCSYEWVPLSPRLEFGFSFYH